jgi:hypothetical protein
MLIKIWQVSGPGPPDTNCSVAEFSPTNPADWINGPDFTNGLYLNFGFGIDGATNSVIIVIDPNR